MTEWTIEQMKGNIINKEKKSHRREAVTAIQVIFKEYKQQKESLKNTEVDGSGPRKN